MATVAPTAEAGDTTPHRPGLVAVVQRVSVSLLIAVVVPAMLFYGFFVIAGVWTVIAAALVWSYGAIAWRAVNKRRADCAAGLHPHSDRSAELRAPIGGGMQQVAAEFGPPRCRAHPSTRIVAALTVAASPDG